MQGKCERWGEVKELWFLPQKCSRTGWLYSAAVGGPFTPPEFIFRSNHKHVKMDFLFLSVNNSSYCKRLLKCEAYAWYSIHFSCLKLNIFLWMNLKPNFARNKKFWYRASPKVAECSSLLHHCGKYKSLFETPWWTVYTCICWQAEGYGTGKDNGRSM